MENIKLDEKKSEDLIYFTYITKEEYIQKKNKFFQDLKDKIIITDLIYKSIMYIGISEYYQSFKLNNIIRQNLNRLTEFKQQEWVEGVCWSIFRSLESTFDALPLNILKCFRNYELGDFIYQIIHNNLVGGSYGGFLSFIEEKNIYINEDEDLIEPISSVGVEKHDTTVLSK